jgi:nitrite reductase (NO-forming)
MVDQMQINRRTILAGAALAGALAPVFATTSAWGNGAIRKASAAEIAALPRQKVELVDPPFVHAHSQVAEGGPKVIEFTMVIEEKKIVIDDAGDRSSRNGFQWHRSRSADGGASGRLC